MIFMKGVHETLQLVGLADGDTFSHDANLHFANQRF